MTEHQDPTAQFLALYDELRRKDFDVWMELHTALSRAIAELRANIDELFPSAGPLRGNLTIVSMRVHILLRSDMPADGQAEVHMQLRSHRIDPDRLQGIVEEKLDAIIAPLIQKAQTLLGTTSEFAPTAPPRDRS